MNKMLLNAQNIYHEESIIFVTFFIMLNYPINSVPSYVTPLIRVTYPNSQQLCNKQYHPNLIYCVYIFQYFVYSLFYCMYE